MLFYNPGGKIKIVAQILFYVGLLLAFLGWAYFLLESKDAGELKLSYINTAMAILIFGGLGSWLINLFIYGFGSLIENSEWLATNLQDIVDKNNDQPSHDE